LDSGNKTYWIQLSSIYAEMQDYADATAVMQVAYDGGILKDDSDYRRLASLLMYTSVPYRAGMILNKEINDGHVKGDSKAYETLANAWIAAREYQKSIAPLQKAAEQSKDGELYMRLGQVHVQLAQWQEASDAFNSAVNKGGLSDPGNADEMMGIAMYNLKKLPQARDWFKKALHYKNHRKTAEGYIQLIDSKIKVKQG
jgi:tetratricopeptide (TPR) repeat protein